MYLASKRGDYLGAYRGDPGLFGSIWSGVKGVARIGAQAMPGPIGGIARAVLGPSRSVPPPAPRAIAPMPARPTFTGVRVGGPMGLQVGVQRQETTRYSADVDIPAAGGCPKGYRPNKSSYFTKDGQYHPAGSKCVKYRYRNVANGRALRRAIGRTAAFDKMVKRNRKALRALAKI